MRHSVADVLKVFGVLSLAAVGCGGAPTQPFGGDALVADGGGTASDAGGLVRGKADASNVYVVMDSGADARVNGSGGAPGSGGSNAASTGGRPGSGGAPAASGGASGSGGARTGGTTGTGTGGAATGGRGSGGATASGGASATGGAAATGGRGTGGAPATGGATATGGAPASGGNDGGPGRGGSPGSGGAAGKGGMPATTAECQRLIEDYDRELMKARECKDLLGSCGTVVPAKLAGCGSGCSVFVEKADKLDDLLKKWSQQDCTAPACAAETCSNAVASLCLVGACTDL